MSLPPHLPRILLASDLSGRCDRAHDRALQFARDLPGELHVVHALDPTPTVTARVTQALPSWRRPADPRAAAARRLREDLGDEGREAQVHVVEGLPEEAVLRVARTLPADLIVTGLARDEPMARLQMGSTADALLRDLPAPLLSVRRRVRGPYRRVVVATDFSPISRPALLAALQWCPNAQVTVFHAYETARAGLGGEAPPDAAWRPALEQQCAAYLDGAGLAASARPQLTQVIERGYAGALLSDYVDHQGVDLVVLGTHGHGGLMKALLGSTAQALMHILECDVMVVRGR